MYNYYAKVSRCCNTPISAWVFVLSVYVCLVCLCALWLYTHSNLMFLFVFLNCHIPSGNRVHSSHAASNNPAGCSNNGKCAWIVLCICVYGYVFVCVSIHVCSGMPVCMHVTVFAC